MAANRPAPLPEAGLAPDTPAADSPTHVLATPRLALRHLAPGDAPFMLELVNEPAWIRNIGDRGVRTVDDAWAYMSKGPVASYVQHGFGLYLVVLRASGDSLGICGLVKRDVLDDVDIGFAFLERFWSRGYACESASAVLAYARTVLGLARIVAITAPHNAGSIRVLERIGLRLEKSVQLPGHAAESLLFATSA